MNTNIISIVKSQLDLDGQTIVAYPHIAMSFDVLLPAFREDNRRAIKAYATVDMIKDTAIRADMLPELIKVELDERSILPSKISSDEAIEAGKEKVIHWVKRRFKLIVTPEVELIEITPVFYHPFILSKDKKDRPIMFNVVRNTVEKWE